MKQLLQFSPAFTPGAAGAGILDFSALQSFSVTKLYAVINVTQNTPVYISGAAGYGFTNIAGPVLTLTVNTSTHNANDEFNIYYEGSNDPLELNYAAEANGNLQDLQQLMLLLLQETRLTNTLLKEGLNIKDELEQLRSDIQREDKR